MLFTHGFAVLIIRFPGLHKIDVITCNVHYVKLLFCDVNAAFVFAFVAAFSKRLQESPASVPF